MWIGLKGIVYRRLVFGFKLFGLIWNGLVEIIMVKSGLELVSLVGFSSMWYVIVYFL